MKTTYRRLFTMIAALLLVCMFITGISFFVLMLNSVRDEKKEALIQDAKVAAQLAQAYDTAGAMESDWSFRLSLATVGTISGTDMLVCDPDGTVLLCTDNPFDCEHIGAVLAEDLLTELKSGSAFRTGSVPGLYAEKRFLVGIPIESETTGDVSGYMVVSAPMSETRHFASRSGMLFLYSAIVVVLLSILAATLLSRSLVRPLAQVAEAARSFGRGNLSVRVELPGDSTDEVRDLALAFNTMADSLETSEQRRQEFVANVSHELKTPMTTIGGFIDGMLDGTIPPEKHRYYMQTVSGEVRRLSRLVRNMLDISRLQASGVEEQRKVRFDIAEMMSDVLISFEQKINAKHLDVSVELPEKTVWTRAERDSITQVLTNLVDNAVKFCPDCGKLSLILRTEGSKALVSVRNTGPTIDPAELPLLFDRFHKADKSRSSDREGWGLGLYIAKTIMGAHGEDLRAASADGVTEFTFTLPVVR